MTTQQPPDDRGLAPRPKRRRLAGPRNVFDNLGALHQQIVDRIVDPVEFGPQGRQTTGTPAIDSGRILAAGTGWAGGNGRIISG
jgi:hypothetical protein